MRGAKQLRDLCKRAGYNYYAMDNAYVGRDKYYRVTKNGFQNTEIFDRPDDRWKRLGVELKPWRRDGKHILMCESSPVCYEYLEAWSWRDRTLSKIKKNSSRRIRIREKGTSDRTLAEDLKDAWVVVTHVSACAVDAILAGVPVIVTGPSVARPLSATFEEIENPPLPDREKWAYSLAYSQFNDWDMRTGYAKAILDEHNVEYDQI